MILNDKQIIKLAEQHEMISPFVNKSVAASIGKAAFFEPDISTSPFITRHGPVIENLSINYFDFAKVIPV